MSGFSELIYVLKGGNPLSVLKNLSSLLFLSAILSHIFSKCVIWSVENKKQKKKQNKIKNLIRKQAQTSSFSPEPAFQDSDEIDNNAARCTRCL